MKIKTNYHTHTYRCKHAEGDIDDFCKAAIENGLEIIAFTDHMPVPDNWHNDIRMSLDELQDYCEKIEQARSDYPQLKIIKGIECEYRPEYTDFYREVLLGQYGMEMLVGGVHFFEYENNWFGLHGKEIDLAMLYAYRDHCLETINAGIFTFLAHPDLFANKYLKWDEHAIEVSRQILSAAEKAKIPLEINGYGVVKGKIETPGGKRWGYPIVEFWELASEYDIEVVINSDAHYPDKILGGLEECYEIANSNGLKIAEMESILEI